MFISGISANAQSKCTCPDLNKLRKENISDTEISTKLITPVSYTHLDVYKRQLPL